MVYRASYVLDEEIVQNPQLNVLVSKLDQVETAWRPDPAELILIDRFPNPLIFVGAGEGRPSDTGPVHELWRSDCLLL